MIATKHLVHFLQETPGALESGDLLPSMDIFSAGCVLTELFLDGTAQAFSFSQLLAYRAGEYEPTKVLKKIDDENIRVRKCLLKVIRHECGMSKSLNL